MSQPSSPRRSLLSNLAALAASVPVFRPGTTVPASAAPFLAAPGAEGGRIRQGSSRVRRSLRLSTVEGIFAELVTACAGGAVLTGWALELGCGPFLVGLLAALPFLAQAVQLPSAWLTAALGRRPVAIAAVGASRLVLLPLALIPLLGLAPDANRALLLGVSFAAAVLGVIGNNAWVAWMGDLVPGPVRGRYFGKRTALCTAGGTVGSIVAGVLLDGARKDGAVVPALALLAVAAVLAGVLTTWLMARQHEPSADGGKETLDLEAALEPWRDRRARAYLRYQVAWNAAIGVSAPFFAVHMLQNLDMGFTLVAIYGAAVALVRILVAPLWGRALDKVGARPVLVACSFGIVVIPILWLFPTPGALWLLALEPLLSGSLWGGHGLAAFEAPLDLAPRRSRPFYLAAFASVGGVAFAAATMAGGLLAGALPAAFELGGHTVYALHVLFVLSAAGRLAGAIVCLRVTVPGSRSVEELIELGKGGLARRQARLLGKLGRPVPAPEPTRTGTRPAL